VVGVWSLFGTALMLALVVRWPLPTGDPTPAGPHVETSPHATPPPVPRQGLPGHTGLRPGVIRPPGTMEP
jgi:hypothetical protein